jgi:hypothetical protein
LTSTEFEKFRRQTLPNVKCPAAHGRLRAEVGTQESAQWY